MKARNRNIAKALAWAAVILVVAIVMEIQGASGSASFGVIAGLSGAAWGSLSIDSPCAKGCLE